MELGLLSTEFWASRFRATGTMLDAKTVRRMPALAAPSRSRAALASRSRRGWRHAAALSIAPWLAYTGKSHWYVMSGFAHAPICLAIGTAAHGWLRASNGARCLDGVAVFGAVAVAATGCHHSRVGRHWTARRLAQIPFEPGTSSSCGTAGDYGPIAMQMVREHRCRRGTGSFHYLAPDTHVHNAETCWHRQCPELVRHHAAELVFSAAHVSRSGPHSSRGAS